MLTRNIIGGFPTKAIAVLSFRRLPPLKNKTKTNDKCTPLWKTFNNKKKKWSLDYAEKSVSRFWTVTRLLELPWARQLFLHLLTKLGEQFTWEKKGMAGLEEWASLAGKWVLMAQCRVPLLAGPTFLAQPHQRGQGETIRVCASIVGSSKEVTFFLNATTSYKNVETLPRNNNLSCFKSLLVASRWDMNSLLPPIQSCSSTFWVWSCIASNFDKGWRGDHKHKIMDRPFMPK